MRLRRPLAALAAACLVATAIVLASRAESPADTATSYVPMTADASCTDPGGQTVVHLTASNLAPGTNRIALGDQGPDRHDSVSLGTSQVSATGSLDATVTIPALTAGLYRIYASYGDHVGVAYFSVPCPTITVTPTCGPADDGGTSHYALTVTGTGYAAPAPDTSPRAAPLNGFGFTTLPVHIGSEGSEFPGSPVKPDADGSFSVLLTPGRARAGIHQIEAYQTSADGDGAQVRMAFRTAYTPFTAPCPVTQTTPTTAPTTAPTTPTTAPTTAPTTPTTAPATTQATTTQTTTTTPTTPVTAAISPSCLEPSANGTSRVQVTGGGFSPGAVDVLLDGDIATRAGADGNGNVTAEIELTPGAADRSITVRQGSRQADVTLRIPCASHPRLTLDPAIGPPGFVTMATGSGFPPNSRIVLAWSPGIGTRAVQTNDKGAFAVPMLVFPQDRTGARVLRATPVEKGRFGRVAANFLCVPGTVQRPQAQTFDFRR